MRKTYLLGPAIGGSMLIAASGAFAATSGALPAAPSAPLAKLAAATEEPAQTGTGGATTAGEETPAPAQPNPKKRRGFFGLPVLGALGLAGGSTAALASGNGNSPASP